MSNTNNGMFDNHNLSNLTELTMDLRQLRHFVAVAEERHFGRAARRLAISQPALSFDIRKLEDRLGVQLLARTSKRVWLTNAGEVLLDEARKLLFQAAEAERLTIRSAHGLAGRLRVGFVNSMLHRGLPAAIHDFGRDHPGVDVTLREMNTSEQVKGLQEGQIDLGCAHDGNFPVEIVSAPLLAESFLCCLPAAHRLADTDTIDPRTLAAEHFIMFPRFVSPHYHDRIVSICVAAGFSPEIRHEVRLWQTVVTMVECGMGIALVPEALARMETTRVRFRRLAGASPVSEIRLLRRSGPPEPGMEPFITCLKAAIGNQSAAG